MSMYESAERIKKDAINLFNSEEMGKFNKWQQKEVINLIIRFGAVAKFRCRSNVAYRNFIDACFSEIAEIGTAKQKGAGGKEYDVITALKIKEAEE